MKLFGRILRIRGMNLYIYCEYAEWICSYTENKQKEICMYTVTMRNEVNLWMKFHWSFTENTRNESVLILKICGMNLFVYWEYAERICTYCTMRIRYHHVHSHWPFLFLCGTLLQYLVYLVLLVIIFPCWLITRTEYSKDFCESSPHCLDHSLEQDQQTFFYWMLS